MSSDKTEPIAKACVVPVCKDRKFSLVHKFPSDHERFKDWINAIQRTNPIPNLKNLTEDAIRKRYFVCCRHFSLSQYKNAQSRSLNITSTPHLNIDNLDELSLSKAWEIDKTPEFIVTIKTNPSPQKTIIPNGPIKILNKEAQNPIIIKDVVKHPPQRKIQTNLTNLAVMKRKPEVKIDQNTPKKVKIIENIEIETIPQLEIDDSKPLTITNDSFKVIPIMNSVIQQKEVEINQDEEVEKPQNKLLALFDVTPEQYEQLKKSFDAGKNIFSLFNNADKEGDDLDSSINDNETDSIEITIEDCTLKFDIFWLRDHCRCGVCYDHVNNQRKLNLVDIPDDISTKDLKSFSLEKGKSLEILWIDGHKSSYDIDFLRKFKHGNLPSILDNKFFWNKNKSEEFLKSCRVTMRDYMTDTQVSKKVLESLHKYGLAFIDGVQATQQNTEFVIRELFPVQKTLFGEMWTFSDVKDHSDTAYTNIYLGSHTDNTYFNDAAGLQILHCIQHTGTGGENFLVDGFAVALKLKEENPEVFQRLTEYIVPAEYIEDGRHHQHYAPIIKLHPSTKEIEQIRFNLYDRSPMNTLNGKELRQFYKDVKILAKEMENDENRISFKLNPGSVMIFDNWRVLHGREKYTGKRVMCGCYVARTEYQSALRVNKIID